MRAAVAAPVLRVVGSLCAQLSLVWRLVCAAAVAAPVMHMVGSLHSQLWLEERLACAVVAAPVVRVDCLQSPKLWLVGRLVYVGVAVYS